MEGDHRVWPPRPGPRHRRSPPYDLPATRRDGAAGSDRHAEGDGEQLDWDDPSGPDRHAAGDGEGDGEQRAFDWSDLGGFTAGASGGGTVTGFPRRGRRAVPEGPAQITAGGREDADSGGNPGPGPNPGRAWSGGDGARVDRPADTSPRDDLPFGDDDDIRWPSSWSGEPEGFDDLDDDLDRDRDRDRALVWDRDRDGDGDGALVRDRDRDGDRDRARALDWDRDRIGRGRDEDRDRDRHRDLGRDRDLDGDFDVDRDRDPDGEPGDGAEEPWSPRFGWTLRGIDRDDPPRTPWQSLPPSARLYGSPTDPGLPARARGRDGRRVAGALLALVVAVAVGAGLIAGVRWIAETPPETGRLDDRQARVALPLPPGWRAGAVPPVTGFTSVARSGDGALVMARPYQAAGEARRAAVEAAELYSRLLLKGDRVSVVEDRPLDGGHTRALRAEYQDVVNRPAYLRVILLTRERGSVLVVGLLQPDDPARRPALDTLMASVR